MHTQQACLWHGRMGVSLEDKHVGEAPDSSPTNFTANHFGVGVELAVLIPNISRKTRTLWGKREYHSVSPRRKRRLAGDQAQWWGLVPATVGKERRICWPTLFKLFIYFSTCGGFSLPSLGWARAQKCRPGWSQNRSSYLSLPLECRD